MTNNEPVHDELRDAADTIDGVGDRVRAGEIDVERADLFADICVDVTNALRQLALLAEATDSPDDQEIYSNVTAEDILDEFE